MTPARPNPPLHRLAVVDSTQDVAFALAAGGAPDRTVVVADAQRAGRGRRGRRWEAAPGTSLLVSIVVRPRLAVAEYPTIALAAGVAVVEALAETAGLAARLKWPNDVVVGGRKIAGVLIESRLGPAPAVVVGVGANLAQRAFPAALGDRATSVGLETGRVPDRDRVLAGLLAAFDRWRARLEEEGFGPVRERWRALADTLGRTVTVDGVTGVAVDLDADGALVLDDGGTRRRVLAGEVVDAAALAAPGPPAGGDGDAAGR